MRSISGKLALTTVEGMAMRIVAMAAALLVATGAQAQISPEQAENRGMASPARSR